MKATKAVLYLFSLLLLSASTLGDDVSPFHEQALKFAPRIRFDQKQGATLGECLPSSAQEYYELRRGGDYTTKVCNMYYPSIIQANIPAYYMAQQCGPHLYLSYWLFFGLTDDCPAGSRGTAVNWARYDVKVMEGEILDNVIFYQFDGWYTRHPGRYSVHNGTHPIAYLGKLRHGTYHDDGGTGTCCYFEDFRNPGDVDQHIDTWRNLVWLRRDENAPMWMNDNAPYYWNGVNLPTFRDIDLCNLRGCIGSSLFNCDTAGCDKSDVNKNDIP